MSKLIINSYDDFAQYVGKDLGESDYHQITQEQINKFAEATLDFQWIHTDVERAKTESPFGSTIAHGYLNLSLLPYLWGQIIEVNNLKMTVNYGIEKMRFMETVRVNDEVRLKAKLNSVVNLRGVTKAEVGAVMEIKGRKKPAFEANVVFLYYFQHSFQQALMNVCFSAGIFSLHNTVTSFVTVLPKKYTKFTA